MDAEDRGPITNKKRRTTNKTHMSTSKVTMTVEEIQAATAALKGLHEKMQFLSPLPAAERAERKRLGPRAVRTAEKRLAAAKVHRESLPVSFDLKRFERDVALMTALDRCVETVTGLRAELQDTLHGVGLRGMSAANEAYAYIKAASAAAPGLKQTVSQLATRRPKRLPKKAESPTPTPGATPTALPVPPPAPPPATPPAASTAESKAA
jgi:hypothetical protein